MAPEIVVRKMHRPACPDLTEHARRLLEEERPWDIERFAIEAEAGWEAESLDWDLWVARQMAWQQELRALLAERAPGEYVEEYGR